MACRQVLADAEPRSTGRDQSAAQRRQVHTAGRHGYNFCYQRRQFRFYSVSRSRIREQVSPTTTYHEFSSDFTKLIGHAHVQERVLGGLAITKHIVQAHGGVIGVKSKAGEGQHVLFHAAHQRLDVEFVLSFDAHRLPPRLFGFVAGN